MKQQVKSWSRCLNLPSSCSCWKSPSLQFPSSPPKTVTRFPHGQAFKFESLDEPRANRRLRSSIRIPLTLSKKQYPCGDIDRLGNSMEWFFPAHLTCVRLWPLPLPPAHFQRAWAGGKEKQSFRILVFPVTYDRAHVHDF